MKLASLLTLPSLALETSAKMLRLLAYVNEVLAERVGPAAPTSPGDDAATAPPAPATAAPEPTSGAGTVPRDIPTLAGLPAPAVVSAVDELSMPELADLYDHESRHRRRRAVLDAVEAALAPPATDDPGGDVRVRDEVVYSTQTPRR